MKVENHTTTQSTGTTCQSTRRLSQIRCLVSGIRTFPLPSTTRNRENSASSSAPTQSAARSSPRGYDGRMLRVRRPLQTMCTARSAPRAGPAR